MGGFGKKYPSTVGEGNGVPGLPVASRSFSAGIARRAARELAPTLAANLTPLCSPSDSGTADSVLMMDPLSPITPAIRPLDSGEAIWALNDVDPADSPAMVTRLGSPPNAAMFCCTQRRAAFWSRSA